MNDKTIDELMEKLPKHSQLYTVPTICRAWGKCRNTVVKWINRGYLRAVIFPSEQKQGKHLITREALREFLQNYTKENKIKSDVSNRNNITAGATYRAKGC